MHETDGYVGFPLETSGASRPRARSAAPAFAPGPRRPWVAELVEAAVSPHLLATHCGKPARGSDHLTPCPADPDRLVALLREGHAAEASAAIEARLRSGAAPQAVMIEDLAPAARRLGRLWDDDICDIVDVSLGLGALHSLLRDIAPTESAPATAPSILILLAPGETHGFGALMVESFFRSAGWRTARSDETRFLVALRREWHDAVGFSVSCDRYVDSLERAVVEARAASRNSRLKVLVGGAIFGDKPELADKIGADLFAADAEAAINIPRILLEELK
jgi:methanogenic corrinoid protein MtbC1